jgi:hypothetical protein
MAQTVISRGFGLLQRIITRGFFSAAAPSPDCYVGFQGAITDSAGYVGLVTSSIGYTGLIADTATATQGHIYPVARYQGIIDSTGLSFEGQITDKDGFEGVICNEC